MNRDEIYLACCAVEQVLLSQSHRFRALVLLGWFLDMGTLTSVEVYKVSQNILRTVRNVTEVDGRSIAAAASCQMLVSFLSGEGL
jgi:hypothetical protein